MINRRIPQGGFRRRHTLCVCVSCPNRRPVLAQFHGAKIITKLNTWSYMRTETKVIAWLRYLGALNSYCNMVDIKSSGKCQYFHKIPAELTSVYYLSVHSSKGEDADIACGQLISMFIAYCTMIPKQQVTIRRAFRLRLLWHRCQIVMRSAVLWYCSNNPKTCLLRTRKNSIVLK